jgi:hypothetical protein
MSRMIKQNINNNENEEVWLEEAKIINIVINVCFGGFDLSEKAIKLYCEKNNIERYGFNHNSVSRTDPMLVEVVKELGDEANKEYTELKIVSVPVGTKYRIAEYDGTEWIETPETIDWETA